MELAYPKKAPETREEFLAFLDENLNLLKILSAKQYINYIHQVTFKQIENKFKVAAEKYGPDWQGLDGINPFEEAHMERLDHVVYVAWDLLQQHFLPKVKNERS